MRCLFYARLFYSYIRSYVSFSGLAEITFEFNKEEVENESSEAILRKVFTKKIKQIKSQILRMICRSPKNKIGKLSYDGLHS